MLRPAPTPDFQVRLARSLQSLINETGASAILEFAVALPLLVIFTVGIYDFSGAFNQKQKLEQAAQEGAIVAAAQPTSDLFSDGAINGNPDSLQPVVTAVVNSLSGSGVVASGGCAPPWAVSGTGPGLTWTYTMACPTNNLVIAINRGWVCASGAPCALVPPTALGSTVTVTYPYTWQSASVIKLIIPGSNSYTTVSQSATTHNQM
jgi:Flp pilus assembly protein TadG